MIIIKAQKITKVPKPKYKVDLRIEEIVAQEAETIDLETARALLHQMVKEVYSRS